VRARAALAEALWRLGRGEEAVGHQRELLRLNPNDNQGLRYRQAHWLLALEAYDELDELFAAYADEGAAAFTYTKALATFGRRGEDAGSRGLLAEARGAQPARPRLPDGPQGAAETAPRLHRLRRGNRSGRLRGLRRRAVGERARRARLA
jgi:tetratricopeptide (TPR) repeat protein